MNQKIRAAYSALGDELSRTIFKRRLLYSLLRDKREIEWMVTECFPGPDALKTKKLCFYGAGGGCASIVRSMRSYRSLDDTFIIDSYKTGSLEGVPIISPDDFYQRPDAQEYMVLIPVVKERFKREIAAELESHECRFLFAFPNTQYFDLKELNLNGEYFVDAGALHGETSAEFFEYCKDGYSYAFEPNPEQYAVAAENLRGWKNVELFPYGLYDYNGTAQFSVQDDVSSSAIRAGGETAVEVRKLDDVLNGRKVTFIKMDIEGSELAALRGAERTITEQRPKLAICVYHKPEDIWEIPAYILRLNPSYKLYLRHYSISDTETVLYAVP